MKSDTPGAPSTPTASNVTPHSAVLSWKPPKSDGGSRIMGYHLEMKDSFSLRWSKVADTIIKDTMFKVTGLKAKGRLLLQGDCGE